jgi:hypothetical protein
MNGLRGVERWWPLAGIGSVVLFVAGLVVTWDSWETDEEILAYYAERGNQIREFVTFFLLAAAALLLLWFSSQLRDALARAEGRSSGAAATAHAGGIGAALLLIAGAAVWVSLAGASTEERFELDPNVARVVGNIGYGLVASAFTIAALLVAGTSVVALRSPFLWRWLGWAGLAVAAVCLLSALFLPWFAFLGWVVAVSAALLLRQRPERRAPEG